MIFPCVLAEPEIYVDNEKTVSVCQGEMEAISAFLKNDGTVEQNFFLRVEAEKEDWASVAPKNITLGPGESGKIFLFVTPEKFSPKKEYSFDVIAYNKEEEVSHTFDVSVRNCHNFNIKAEEEMEGCVGKAVEFPVYIENAGQYTDDVTLDIEVVEANKTEVFNFTLAPDETESVKIKFTPTDVANYTFVYSLRVNELEDYVEKAESLFISKNCAGADIEVKTIPADLCIGEEYDILFDVKNTGNTKDVFTFSSPSLNILTEKVELDPNEVYELVTEYIPNASSQKVILNIESEQGFSDKKSFAIKARPCCDTSLISPPGEIKVCKGEMAQVDIKLALLNDAVPATYTIKSQYDWIFPHVEKLEVKKNEEKEFFARVRIPDKAGAYRSIITASSENCEDKAHVSLNVENCYSFEADLEVEDEECKCSEAEMELEIENTGGVVDTYTVAVIKPYEAEIGQYEVKSGESKTIGIPYNTSCKDDKEEIMIKVTSQANPLLSEVLEEEIELDDCYDFEINAYEKIDFCANEERNVEVHLENTGTSTDTYNITPLCPPWVDDESFEKQLGPGEKVLFSYKAKAPEATDKEAFCSFRLSSEKGNKTKVVSTILNVLSTEECYCFNATLEKDKVTFEGINKTNQVVDLAVSNCGRSKEEFLLEVFGDLKKYVEIKPETLEVNPGETDAFHVGVSFPLEGEKGELELELSAENSNKKEDFTLSIE